MTRNVKWALVLLTCVCMLALGGCNKGMIRADAIDGLADDVTMRHDKLVKESTTISEADKATYLRSSELLRKVIKTAKE